MVMVVEIGPAWIWKTLEPGVALNRTLNVYPPGTDESIDVKPVAVAPSPIAVTEGTSPVMGSPAASVTRKTTACGIRDPAVCELSLPTLYSTVIYAGVNDGTAYQNGIRLA